MLKNYEDCLQRVLKHEGGYTNEASDPGGPTNFGITIIDYRKYVNPNATAEDVRNMKLAEAQAIYKSKYWDAQNCSNLPSGVDYCVFDYGVNSGIGRTKKVLAKFEDIKDPVKLINAICDERMAFLRKLKIWPTYANGWTRRVTEVREHSVELAKQDAVAMKPKPMDGAGSAGTILVGGGYAAWQFKDHMPEIIIGTAVLAFVAWMLVRWYKQQIKPRIAANAHVD